MLEASELSVWIKSASKQLSQVTRLYPAVVVNLLLTQAIWILVYGCKEDDRLSPAYFLNSKTNFTTGNDIYDGLLNGVSSIIMVAFISFVMLAFAWYNYKLLVKSWLSLSCLLIMWGVFPGVCFDALSKFGPSDSNLAVAIAISTAYAGVGTMVFFTNRMPLWTHQMFVVCNCCLVSLFYLRMLPAHTAWFVLSMIVVWDAFAVLAPVGPLRMVLERASDYSHSVLRMLMFEAENRHDEGQVADSEIKEAKEEDKHSGNEEQEDELEGAKTALSFSNDGIAHDAPEGVQESDEAATDEKTALDALEDTNVVHLGMGDFVFYSLLVGKSAASGVVLCPFAAGLGVLVGLFITLGVLSSPESTCPALPVSICLGMLFHFGVFFVGSPFVEALPEIMFI